MLAAAGRCLTAAAALVLPPVCGGCGTEGAWWCAGCARSAHEPVRVQELPDGTPCWTAAGYDGPAGRALVAHKERGAVALRDPLAGLLARAVRRAATDAGPPVRRVVLVPVPSTASARRRRGADVVGDLAGRAARSLRAGGVEAAALPVLRHRRRVLDQAGLGREERAANLRGALGLRVAPRRAAGLRRAGLVVVVDDVVTTGATLAEAVRVLRGPVPPGAVVAAAALRA